MKVDVEKPSVNESRFIPRVLRLKCVIFSISSTETKYLDFDAGKKKWMVTQFKKSIILLMPKNAKEEEEECE